MWVSDSLAIISGASSEIQASLCEGEGSGARGAQVGVARSVYWIFGVEDESENLCRSKCPKNNFDRTTSPASSHRTNPSVASHTPRYSLVPSHEPIGFIVHSSYSSRAYANHIAWTGSCAGAPNIAGRTRLLLIALTLWFSLGDFPPFLRDKLEVGGPFYRFLEYLEVVLRVCDHFLLDGRLQNYPRVMIRSSDHSGPRGYRWF